MSLVAAIKRRCRRAGEGGIAKRCASAGAKCSAGFTLTEVLATVIIVGLVTSILASGIALATKQYYRSMAVSGSQMLYTSLQRVLDTELSYTNTILVEEGKVVGFYSTHFFAKDNRRTPFLCVTDEKGVVKTGNEVSDHYGRLAFATSRDSSALTNPVLGSGAYNYGLEARVVEIKYNSDTKYFTVELAISNDGGQTNLVDQSFSVRAMNAIEEKPAY